MASNAVKHKVHTLRSLWQGTFRKNATTIGIATIVSRVLGYVREVLMASVFGTSLFTDAWLMASVLPNLLFGALYGAVSNLIVPLYLEAKEDSRRKSADQFLQEIFTLLTVLAVVMSIAAYFGTPLIVRGIAPGFHGLQYHLTVTMTRIMLPTFLFWLWAGLFSALLQSLNIYGPPAWAPVLLNIVRITFIILLGRIIGIEGVAWGFTVGVGLQLVILIRGISKCQLQLRFRWSMRHTSTKKFIRLSGPVIFTSLTGAMGVIVDRIFASSLPIGTIAALNYSFLLVQVPIGLLIAPLVTPTFTRLSQRAVKGDRDAWTKVLLRSTFLLTTVMFVITGFIFFTSTRIIRIVYQHGMFNSTSTALTSSILPYFAIGLIPMALNQLLLKALVSLQKTNSLVLLTIMATMTNITVDAILVHVMQGRGLALGTALAQLVSAMGFAYILVRYKPTQTTNL